MSVSRQHLLPGCPLLGRSRLVERTVSMHEDRRVDFRNGRQQGYILNTHHEASSASDATRAFLHSERRLLVGEAFAPAMESFRCGRDFAAWLGLVPRQFSSGGKERLGRVSKAGQADIRRLLLIGAMARVSWASRKPSVQGTWLSRMLAKKPRMLVAIALANKMARTIWAMLTKQEDYRDPALAMAA